MVVVVVDEDDYCKGVEELKLIVVGRLSLQQGHSSATTIEVKNQLSEFWKILDFKDIPLEKGMFHILLYILKDQCKALSIGILFLKIGLMRFNIWVLGFSESKQVQSTT